MSIPRLLTACALMSVTACAGRYRTELVGQGTAFVQPRGTAPAPEAAAPFTLPPGGIQLPRGSYDLALWFDIPRAQTIDYTVSCTGATINGSIGEPFEQYRARRIAELQAQRDRQRQQVAAAASTVVQAYVPPPPPPPPPAAPEVHATGYLQTPVGAVRIEGHARGPELPPPPPARVQVDAQAVGGMVGEVVVPVDEDIQLPPGDVGQGTLASRVHVETTGDGVCAVTAATDDPNVRARFEVRRIRDLDAEARLRIMATTSHAVDVRKRLVANLVVEGASPEVRARRLEVEARLRAEAEARLAAEASARVQVTYQAHAQADARVRAFLDLAYGARQRYLAYLVGECHADPNLRGRIAAEREARVEADIAARARIDRELHDREQIRIDIALRARMQLTATLLALGAIERPPMPAPFAEDPGSAPFDGAHWTAGKWTWTGGRWIWTRGGWSDPDVFTRAGGDVRIGGGISIGVDLGGTSRGDGTNFSGSRDHRTEPATPVVRDHRDAAPAPVVRDHRDAAPTYQPPPPPPRAEPVVRDHRDDKKDEPKTRDHRH